VHWEVKNCFSVGGGGVSGAEVDVVIDPAACEDEGGVGIW
jgi:hypothetical protein